MNTEINKINSVDSQNLKTICSSTLKDCSLNGKFYFYVDKKGLLKKMSFIQKIFFNLSSTFRKKTESNIKVLVNNLVKRVKPAKNMIYESALTEGSSLQDRLNLKTVLSMKKEDKHHYYVENGLLKKMSFIQKNILHKSPDSPAREAIATQLVCLASSSCGIRLLMKFCDN